MSFSSVFIVERKDTPWNVYVHACTENLKFWIIVQLWRRFYSWDQRCVMRGGARCVVSSTKWTSGGRRTWCAVELATPPNKKKDGQASNVRCPVHHTVCAHDHDFMSHGRVKKVQNLQILTLALISRSSLASSCMVLIPR